MNNRNLIGVIIGLLIVTVLLIIFYTNQKEDRKPGILDGFAQCIKNSGATFYGAFWCPHCKAQKEAFGSSVKYLPYVECSLPDGNGQTTICQNKKIEGYPTWEFTDGSRLTGEVALDKLAEKTKCQLPAGFKQQ
jgi:thiol-disulfide isomerase/thioredoxin